MRPWHLGNTTVRSPFRLREGLVALSASPLQGYLRGKKQEQALRRLLGEHGIVELGRDETYSVGRKWRSALGKLGFLYPEVPTLSGVAQGDIGPIDMITQNGWRLIRAETVPAMQECFLRALAAYYIPSVTEKQYDFSVFSPLRHVLNAMLEVEKQTGESRLEFLEMALIVQLTSADDDLADIIHRILDLRERRSAAGNKRRFDYEARGQVATAHGYVAQTLNDYADTNFRYLKATGLVQAKGRGLTLIPGKRVFIEKLIEDTNIPGSPRSYFLTLCNGAVLPTDNKDAAMVVLKDLLNQVEERGIPFSARGKPLGTPADIALVRHEIEKLLSESNEEKYAARQATEWQEIAAYMDMLGAGGRSKLLPTGKEIELPQAEKPAYFEWILWRAFLAIDSLMNKPYQARRFKIDQDFLPVGTAPGNGPDLIFEFEDYILVVEVTLMDSSRQEAMEGEPVRRHVADIVLENAEKPVYGLFIANRIDSNTAETFRIGCWYRRDDTKMTLDIIPLTLEQFRSFFAVSFETGKVSVDAVRELLDICSGLRRDCEAPQWKMHIDAVVKDKLREIAACA